MTKDLEGWALKCGAKHSAEETCAGLIFAKNNQSEVIPFFRSKELADLTTSDIVAQDGTHPGVVKIKISYEHGN